GTAQYLSPEQARGERVDARSDIYSLGCVLYEILAGEPPFVGDSPVAVAYQHVSEEPSPPSQINPAISRELDAVVLRAMSKNLPGASLWPPRWPEAATAPARPTGPERGRAGCAG